MNNLLVKMLDGKTLAFKFHSQTISGKVIMEEICGITGIPARCQLLLSQGCHIHSETPITADPKGLFPTIHLLLRLVGGSSRRRRRFVLTHLVAAAMRLHRERRLYNILDNRNQFAPHRIEEPEGSELLSKEKLREDFFPIKDLMEQLLVEFPVIDKKGPIHFYIHQWVTHGRLLFRTVREHFSMILRLNSSCNSGPSMSAFLHILGIVPGCYCTANGIMLAVMYRIGHRVGIVAQVINGELYLSEIEIFLTKAFEIMDAPIDNLFEGCNWGDYLKIASS